MTQVALEGPFPQETGGYQGSSPQALRVSEASSWTSPPQLKMGSGRPRCELRNQEKKFGTWEEGELAGEGIGEGPWGSGFQSSAPDPKDSRIKPDSRDS